MKDLLFYADRLFIKKAERGMALIMIMTLSLLVYSLAERRNPFRDRHYCRSDEYEG
jgi:transposase